MPSVDIGQLLDRGSLTSRQKFFVFLAALTIVFDGIDNQLLAIALPSIMREWALPRPAFAPVLACGMVGMMAGGAAAGVLGDKYGRRIALIASVLVFGLFTAAAAAAEGLWTLGIVRLIAGLGLGGALPNAAALASECVSRRNRPFAVTLTIVCVPLGGTLAAFVGGRLLPITGWRTVFVLGGILSIAVAALLVRFLPESPRYLARHPERWPDLATVLRRIGHDVPASASFVDTSEQALSRPSVSALFTPEFRRDTLALWGAFLCCLHAVYVAFNWVPSMLTDAGLGIGVASNGLLAFNLGGVAGAVGGGLVIARLGSRPTMLAMSAGAVAGALALAATPVNATADALLIVALLGFTGALINAVQTTMYALAANVYPTAVRATGVGTAVAFGRTGGVVSTYAGSWALEAGGTAGFFGLIAASMTIVFVSLALVRKHVRPTPRPHAPSPQSA